MLQSYLLCVHLIQCTDLANALAAMVVALCTGFIASSPIMPLCHIT